MIRTANNQSGFTLLEIMIAISLFGLLLVLGYRSISTTAISTKQFQQFTDNYQQIRDAHRVLRQAIESGAAVSGDSLNLNLNLETANSQWLNTTNSINFKITIDGRLTAITDQATSATTLITGLDNAGFRFLTTDANHKHWSKNGNPNLIEFSWSKQNQRQQWQFLSRQ